MTSWVRSVALAAALTLVCGCSHRGMVLNYESQDSLHYVVIGFGMVSVPKSTQPDAVTATKFNAVGISVSNQPGLSFGVGYSSSSVVAVPANAEDVRVDVGSCAGGGVRVTADRAVLKEPVALRKED
jgi:hypothetical protein